MDSPSSTECQHARDLFQSSQFSALEVLARDLTIRYPRNGFGWMMLATALKKLERLKESLMPMRKAIELIQNNAELCSNLGNTLWRLGAAVEAESSYRRAIFAQSNNLNAIFNLGTLLTDQKRYLEAEHFFRIFTRLDPEDYLGHYKLGLTLYGQGKYTESELCYRRALDINKNESSVFNSIGYTLLSQGRAEEALEYIEKAIQIQPNSIEFLGNYLFSSNYSPNALKSNYVSNLHRFGEAVRNGMTQQSKYLKNPKHTTRLRIGLVSGDFRQHSITFFIKSIFTDRENSMLDFFAYSTSPVEDVVTCWLKPYFAKWTEISDLSDADARMSICADEIQILIDLSGHTSGNRLLLFSDSPAPVQVSWLGYPASTALDQIDYVLSDPYASRRGDEIFFTEKIWRLPNTSICFSPPPYNIRCRSLPALASGSVTFGCLNNLAKINDHTISVWAKILESVPNSRLYLKNTNLSDPGTQRALLARFQRYGVSADRISLNPALRSVSDHLLQYNKIDIALDTFPYPGVTTTIESLWMGVPVITLEGQGNMLRLGESIALNVNLSDWIAVDEDDYINKAIRFSRQTAMLAELRLRLRSRLIESPLIDAKKYSKDFEEAMWNIWREFGSRFETTHPGCAYQSNSFS